MLLIQTMPPILDAQVACRQGLVAAGLSPPALLAGLVGGSDEGHVEQRVAFIRCLSRRVGMAAEGIRCSGIRLHDEWLKIRGRPRVRAVRGRQSP